MKAVSNNLIAQRLTVLIPFATALITIMLSAVPWGIPANSAFVFPMITLSVIFYWGLVKSNYLPVWLVFLIGIATDILTDGPIGYWSLLYVLTRALSSEIAHFAGARGFWFKWVAFGVSLAPISLLAWGLASIYFLRLIDGTPFVYSAAITLLVFPLICFALSPFLPFMEPKRGYRRYRV